jgi:hypothetical protein
MSYSRSVAEVFTLWARRRCTRKSDLPAAAMDTLTLEPPTFLTSTTIFNLSLYNAGPTGRLLEITH